MPSHELFEFLLNFLKNTRSINFVSQNLNPHLHIVLICKILLVAIEDGPEENVLNDLAQANCFPWPRVNL